MLDFSSFWIKADENLKAAQLCFDSGFYNACANRAYYSVFHAAVAILIAKGFPPTQKHIDHGWVQSNFVGELINRRKILQSKFKSYLQDAQMIRNDSDYKILLISQKIAKRQLSKSIELFTAIKEEIKK